MYTFVRYAVQLAIFCYVTSFLQTQSSCERISARDELVKDLLTDYHSSVEPTGKIDLKFSLALVCVRYDKTSGELNTNAAEKYSWTDFRLSWNPRKYDGIRKMRLPASLIWKPDIDCYNALEVESRSNENVFISNEGNVDWIPRSFYKTLCTNNGSKIACDLSFGSWTYDQHVLAMETVGTGIYLGHYSNGTCPWDVESHSSAIRLSYYPCCKEPYATLDIKLFVKPHEGHEAHDHKD